MELMSTCIQDGKRGGVCRRRTLRSFTVSIYLAVPSQRRRQRSWNVVPFITVIWHGPADRNIHEGRPYFKTSDFVHPAFNQTVDEHEKNEISSDGGKMNVKEGYMSSHLLFPHSVHFGVSITQSYDGTECVAAYTPIKSIIGWCKIATYRRQHPRLGRRVGIIGLLTLNAI